MALPYNYCLAIKAGAKIRPLRSSTSVLPQNDPPLEFMDATHNLQNWNNKNTQGLSWAFILTTSCARRSVQIKLIMFPLTALHSPSNAEYKN